MVELVSQLITLNFKKGEKASFELPPIIAQNPTKYKIGLYGFFIKSNGPKAYFIFSPNISDHVIDGNKFLPLFGIILANKIGNVIHYFENIFYNSIISTSDTIEIEVDPEISSGTLIIHIKDSML